MERPIVYVFDAAEDLDLCADNTRLVVAQAQAVLDLADARRQVRHAFEDGLALGFAVAAVLGALTAALISLL